MRHATQPTHTTLISLFSDLNDRKASALREIIITTPQSRLQEILMQHTVEGSESVNIFCGLFIIFSTVIESKEDPSLCADILNLILLKLSRNHIRQNLSSINHLNDERLSTLYLIMKNISDIIEQSLDPTPYLSVAQNVMHAINMREFVTNEIQGGATFTCADICSDILNLYLNNINSAAGSSRDTAHAIDLARSYLSYAVPLVNHDVFGHIMQISSDAIHTSRIGPNGRMDFRSISILTACHEFLGTLIARIGSREPQNIMLTANNDNSDSSFEVVARSHYGQIQEELGITPDSLPTLSYSVQQSWTESDTDSSVLSEEEEEELWEEEGEELWEEEGDFISPSVSPSPCPSTVNIAPLGDSCQSIRSIV